jgi:hypothetical protein
MFKRILAFAFFAAFAVGFSIDAHAQNLTPTLTLTTGTSDWATTGNAVNYAGSDLLFIEVTSAGTCTTPPANIIVNVTGRMQ